MIYKTILLCVLLIFSGANLYGQKAEDSLFIEKHQRLRKLVIENPALALEEALALESNNRDVSDQGLALLIKGNSKWALGEFPKALKYYYEAMQLFEASDNIYGRITVYNDASLIFIEESDYADGLDALHKARDLNARYGSQWLDAVIYSNIGDVFLRTDQLDSASYYTDLSYTYAKQTQDSSLYPFILKNQATIYLKQNDRPKARIKFDESLQVSEALKDAFHEIEILQVAGDYFSKSGELDSALNFYTKGLRLAEQIDTKKEILNISEKLHVLHERLGQIDSAYYYSKKVMYLNDSILGADKIRLSNHYEVMEGLRQEQLKAEEERKLESQKNLMQYTVIGIIILLCIGLSFMLRKIKIPPFWFEVFLIVVLLVIFECITLAVHTFAAEVTHHSPILMLLILVVIASVLGPLHHHSVKHAKRIFIRKGEEMKST